MQQRSGGGQERWGNRRRHCSASESGAQRPSGWPAVAGLETAAASSAATLLLLLVDLQPRPALLRQPPAAPASAPHTPWALDGHGLRHGPTSAAGGAGLRRAAAVGAGAAPAPACCLRPPARGGHSALQRRLRLRPPQADEAGGGRVLHRCIGVAEFGLLHKLLPQLFHVLIPKRQAPAAAGQSRAGFQPLSSAVARAGGGRGARPVLLAWEAHGRRMPWAGITGRASGHGSSMAPRLCQGPARVMPSQKAATLGHSMPWLIR